MRRICNKGEMVDLRMNWERREGAAFVRALCLCVLVVVAGMTMFPALSPAEELDDFGLTEVDPELPQKIRNYPNLGFPTSLKMGWVTSKSLLQRAFCAGWEVRDVFQGF